MQLGEQRHESEDERLTELTCLVMGTFFLVVKLLLYTGLKVTEVAHDIQVQHSSASGSLRAGHGLCQLI